VVFLAFLIAVAAEIAAFIVVGEHIGFLLAVLILLAVSALGPVVVSRVGLSVIAHTKTRVARGELPGRELLDGLVVVIGGVMICVPGFVGDAIGLLLMIGPVRHLVIRVAGHRLARRVSTMRTPRWRVIDVNEAPHSDVAPPPPPLGPGSSPP
jgi:UPF0716 protein FxsA